MGLSNRQFARTRAEPIRIPTGRHTQVSYGYTTTLSPVSPELEMF